MTTETYTTNTIYDTTNGHGQGPGPPTRAARIPRTAETLSAGTNFYRMVMGLFALNENIDDAEREFGPRIWEAMMNDPAVGSSVDVIRQGAVRTPTIAPVKTLRTRPGQDATPQESQALEIAEFLQRAWHNPQRPLIRNAERMDVWAGGGQVG